MITFNELLHGNLISDVPLSHQHNLEELLVKINQIRVAYAQPMIVTSGYRTEQKQRDIYAAKGKPVPWGSQHLIGCAVDILDKDGALAAWVHANEDLLASVGLWCEATEKTPGWTHFQAHPPASGHRFFQP